MEEYPTRDACVSTYRLGMKRTTGKEIWYPLVSGKDDISSPDG